MSQGDVVLTDPWIDLRNPAPEFTAHSERLQTELRLELSPDHTLEGRPFEVVGFSVAADDILLRTSDAWAIVHLTWSRSTESPPWPTTRFFATVADVEEAMDCDT